jgi:hypothetical protein
MGGTETEAQQSGETDDCTWSVGGATWKLIHAHWAVHDRDADAETATDPAPSEQELARLTQRMRYWLAKQNSWSRASYSFAGISFVLLVLRRDKLSVATFVACILMAMLSFSLMGIRF